jgi:hypothetical protein
MVDLNNNKEEKKSVAKGEKILGFIKDIEGGPASWDDQKFTIYLTNTRVIFARHREPRTIRDVEGSFGWRMASDQELYIDKARLESRRAINPDKILTLHRKNFAVNYNDFESLEFMTSNIRDLRDSVSFIYKGQKYIFKIPYQERHLINRWEEIYNRVKEQQRCPECLGVLRGPFRYCRNCDKRYLADTSDLRAAYRKESRREVTTADTLVGIIIMFFGFVFMAIITVMLFPAFQASPLVFFGVCLPIPVIMIILGILMARGIRAGKLILGILIIISGVAMILSAIIDILGILEGGTISLSSSNSGYIIVGLIILLFGSYIVRENLLR